MNESAAARRRAVVIAGHVGDEPAARAGATDIDPAVRRASLGALDRLGVLSDDDVRRSLGDTDPDVRRRGCELAAVRPAVALIGLLDDPDPTVVEFAAWACGEQAEHSHAVDHAVVDRLAELTVVSSDALVREASAAALGAIGDERGLPAILSACADRPHVRRRAVLALAPFDGPEVAEALNRAEQDRDWQVRQSAEDLRRASGDGPL